MPPEIELLLLSLSLVFFFISFISIFFSVSLFSPLFLFSLLSPQAALGRKEKGQVREGVLTSSINSESSSLHSIYFCLPPLLPCLSSGRVRMEKDQVKQDVLMFPYISSRLPSFCLLFSSLFSSYLPPPQAVLGRKE